MMRPLLFFSIFGIFLVWNASAQAIENLPEDTVVQTVTVTGATPQRARDFAKAVAPNQRSLDLLARWDDKICVSVAGPPIHQSQFIADRISQRAYDVGLRPGGPGCKTNLLIVVTGEPDKVIARLLKDEPDVFGFNETSAVETAGLAAFKAFQTNRRPVRAWTVAETFGADGMPLDGESTTGGNGGTTLPGNTSVSPSSMSGVGPVAITPFANVPMVRTDGTRLSSAVRSDISRVVVIVDARTLKGRSLAAVADYTAFASLAQVDPDVDATGFDSILNLFTSVEAAAGLKSGMTEWDRAYLSSLYRSKRNAASLSRQIYEIGNRMVNE
jgi:hypothetical protein